MDKPEWMPQIVWDAFGEPKEIPWVTPEKAAQLRRNVGVSEGEDIGSFLGKILPVAGINLKQYVKGMKAAGIDDIARKMAHDIVRGKLGIPRLKKILDDIPELASFKLEKGAPSRSKIQWTPAKGKWGTYTESATAQDVVSSRGMYNPEVGAAIRDVETSRDMWKGLGLSEREIQKKAVETLLHETVLHGAHGKLIKKITPKWQRTPKITHEKMIRKGTHEDIAYTGVEQFMGRPYSFSFHDPLSPGKIIKVGKGIKTPQQFERISKIRARAILKAATK